MNRTREALIDVAARLLDEGGTDAVTLRQVGHGAGVSHNAPYKHFAGKEALLAAVAARELQGLRTAMERAAEGQRPGDALRTVLVDYAAWALRYPARFKLVFGRWSIECDELAEAATAANAAFVDLVAASQRDGELPAGDAVRLAALIRALAHGAADLALAGHLAGERKGAVEPGELIEDLLGYLKSR